MFVPLFFTVGILAIIMPNIFTYLYNLEYTVFPLFSPIFLSSQRRVVRKTNNSPMSADFFRLSIFSLAFGVSQVPSLKDMRQMLKHISVAPPKAPLRSDDI